MVQNSCPPPSGTGRSVIMCSCSSFNPDNRRRTPISSVSTEPIAKMCWTCICFIHSRRCDSLPRNGFPVTIKTDLTRRSMGFHPSPLLSGSAESPLFIGTNYAMGWLQLDAYRADPEACEFGLGLGKPFLYAVCSITCNDGGDSENLASSSVSVPLVSELPQWITLV